MKKGVCAAYIRRERTDCLLIGPTALLGGAGFFWLEWVTGVLKDVRMLPLSIPIILFCLAAGVYSRGAFGGRKGFIQKGDAGAGGTGSGARRQVCRWKDIDRGKMAFCHEFVLETDSASGASAKRESPPYEKRKGHTEIHGPEQRRACNAGNSLFGSRRDPGLSELDRKSIGFMTRTNAVPVCLKSRQGGFFPLKPARPKQCAAKMLDNPMEKCYSVT